MNNLQDLLINKRKELNLSLRDASKLIGISHSYLSSIEKGFDPRNNTMIKPTPDTLKLLSGAYGISYEHLMTLAGYLGKTTSKELNLARKEDRDILKIAEQLRDQFNEAPESFSLSGEPLSPKVMEFILDALEFGIYQAKKLNKE
jgi:transcriptional regulator with XRE-family HTH domain